MVNNNLKQIAYCIRKY